MKILKIKIRVAQNVGKVWISRRQILLAPFYAISDNFSHGPENSKKYLNSLTLRVVAVDPNLSSPFKVYACSC